MNYILVHDYTKSPLLIYDYCATKNVPYKITDASGRFLCKMNLWQKMDEEITDTNEIYAINSVLGLPKKRVLDEEKIVVYINNESSRLYFASCRNPKTPDGQIIVCYSLFEKQPSRYQCYVIAVLKAIPTSRP